jgi:hypothetical protein
MSSPIIADTAVPAANTAIAVEIPQYFGSDDFESKNILYSTHMTIDVSCTMFCERFPEIINLIILPASTAADEESDIAPASDIAANDDVPANEVPDRKNPPAIAEKNTDNCLNAAVFTVCTVFNILNHP